MESRYLEEKHGRGYYGLDEITGDMYCIGDEALKLVDGDKAIPVRNLDPELQHSVGRIQHRKNCMERR